jgi:rubrerythrin
MPKAEQDLKEAFAGESQANRRYLAFAKKADAEGYPEIAKLFRAGAEAETIHAMNDIRLMGIVKTTAENLEAAIAGEGYETETMYPGFFEDAKAEGNRGAMGTFSDAMRAEKVHHDLYASALAALKSGKDLSTAAVWVCPVCGNVEFGSPPERCPICDTAGSKWFEVK